MRDVLLRTEVQRKFPILAAAAHAFRDRIRQIGTYVDPVPGAFTLRRDPDDAQYLNVRRVAEQST